MRIFNADQRGTWDLGLATCISWRFHDNPVVIYGIWMGFVKNKEDGDNISIGKMIKHGIVD